MTTIIAGGFTTNDAAERAMQHLIAAGVNEDNLCSFRVNPPGEHDGLPTGGDRPESPGATQAGGGAVRGAAVGAVAGAAAGAVAATVLGPVAIAGGAGVGAYTGALVGALGSMDPATHRDEMRFFQRHQLRYKPTAQSPSIFSIHRADSSYLRP